MANTSVALTSLDFDEIKSNLKEYLKRSNSPFKDYDYEGSNMNVLLDVLAYNTYLNSFYLNMVSREMFLDTAQTRDSVLSHVKELNYVPRSYRSSEAQVSFNITPSSAISQLIVPRGTSFTTRVGSNSYTFSTEENVVLSLNSNGYFEANSLTIYEGTYVYETFVYVSSNNTQRFVLSNPTVDTRSIVVSIIENNGANVVPYTRATSFLGLNSNSTVYFLQGAENTQFELLFGDDVIARRPRNGSTILVEYRVCNGELPNGTDVFDIDGPIQGQANISAISTVRAASSGAVTEAIESIKFNAPRYYQNQDRAITTSDYENLLKANFPVIDAIAAFGGEELDPPQYGKVYISVDIANADGTPQGLVDEFYNFIKPRSPLSIDPVFVDPDFLYLDVYSKVRYNVTQTNLRINDIKTLVVSAISQYNTDNISDFKKTLRYSRLTNYIDESHFSIISNDTFIRPFKIITPLLGRVNNIVVNFGFELSAFNNLTPYNLENERASITSTSFTFDNRSCHFNDDGLGNINIVTTVGNNHQVLSTVGTVDYRTGTIILNNFNIQSYDGEGIKIFVDTVTKDIFSSKNVILEIRDIDIRVDVEAIRV